MDDHMIDRIARDIELCFFVLKMNIDQGLVENVTEDEDYKSARVLIKAHNELVKLYYYPEYVKTYSYAPVAKAWKMYLERNNA